LYTRAEKNPSMTRVASSGGVEVCGRGDGARPAAIRGVGEHHGTPAPACNKVTWVVWIMVRTLAGLAPAVSQQVGPAAEG